MFPPNYPTQFDPLSPSPVSADASFVPSYVPHTGPTEPTDLPFMVDHVPIPSVSTDPKPAPATTPEPGSSESELPQPPSAAQHVHFDTFTTVLCAASSYLLLLLGLVRSF